VSGIDLSDGAHISGGSIAAIVRWVRGVLGPAGVERLLEHAGETRPLHEVEDVERWSSYRQATALYEAAVSVTGRSDAARRIGEEMLAQHRGTPVMELLRSLGSPEALLESIAQSGAKFSTVFAMTAHDVAAGRATVVGTTPPGVPRHRLLCDFTVGILSMIPAVFDVAPATVTHGACQARGGEACVYTLTWDTERAAGLSADEQRLHRLENELEGVQLRLNTLRRTAADIVTATDVNAALETITARAGAAVRATRYLLAVRMPTEDRLRVRCAGMPQDEAEALAPTLLEQSSSASTIVAPVASTTRGYGVLAVMMPAGATFFAQEQELVAAYAGYAASVLDTAWAIEDARRQTETARALLDLSFALAELAAPHEVAQRLADAVPRVVDCDKSAVLLWDDEDKLLRLAGSRNASDAVVRALSHGIGLPDTPALTEMLVGRAPMFLSPEESDPFLRGLLQTSESTASVVVPIVGGGRFLGVVTAGVSERPERLCRSSSLLERLEGLASQAATALTNARLVGELRRQALVDALTGLPNRIALVDRMDQALQRARRDGTDCALLFLDLDRFKEVNDRRGHLAGDELLVQVAQRVQDSVRGCDTVARLGGDEFAVLLPGIDDLDDPLATADRILHALSAPFLLGGPAGGGPVSIGVSIGIGTGRRGAASGTELLREADDAMYIAKAAGGGVARTAAPRAAARGGAVLVPLARSAEPVTGSAQRRS
jgi:diguanylate cyclase (GGDEF)-like protein